MKNIHDSDKYYTVFTAMNIVRGFCFSAFDDASFGEKKQDFIIFSSIEVQTRQCIDFACQKRRHLVAHLWFSHIYGSNQPSNFCLWDDFQLDWSVGLSFGFIERWTVMEPHWHTEYWTIFVSWLDFSWSFLTLFYDYSLYKRTCMVGKLSIQPVDDPSQCSNVWL
jgi:hypothetical protein